MTTPYHSQYWAHALTLRGASGTIEALSRSIAGACVDLNPHQVDAALFAIHIPFTRRVPITQGFFPGDDEQELSRRTDMTGSW